MSMTSNEKQMLIPCSYVGYETVQDDEIDLRDLWRTVVKRRFTLFIIVILFIAGAFTYISIAKPVYEAKALLQIGKIGTKLLDEPTNVKEKLVALYKVGDKNVVKEYPYLSSVSVPKKSTMLVKLTVLGLDNDSAKSKLSEIAKGIEADHGRLIDEYVTLKESDLKRKREDLKKVESELNMLSKIVQSQSEVLKSLSKNGSQKGFTTLSVELSNNIQRLNVARDAAFKLKNEISELEAEISPINIKKSQIVGGVTIYDKPVKPKKMLVMAVAIITGFMVGLFAIFFMEWISKEKEEASEPKG